MMSHHTPLHIGASSEALRGVEGGAVARLFRAMASHGLLCGLRLVRPDSLQRTFSYRESGMHKAK